MAVLAVAAIFGLLLCWLAFRANARFRGETRLPMQWWLTGEVTWSAPRGIALAFVPVLAIGVLGLSAFLALTTKPRAGQEALLLPTLIGVGTLFVAVQLFHFRLIARTLRRSAR